MLIAVIIYFKSNLAIDTTTVKEVAEIYVSVVSQKFD